MIKFEDDLDVAIVGPAFIWGPSKSRLPVLVYNAEIIRTILCTRDGMSAEEAREYIEYNIEGAYLGEDTPILVWPDDEIWVDNDD